MAPECLEDDLSIQVDPEKLSRGSHEDCVLRRVEADREELVLLALAADAKLGEDGFAVGEATDVTIRGTAEQLTSRTVPDLEKRPLIISLWFERSLNIYSYHIVDLTCVRSVFRSLDVTELCGVDEDGSRGCANGQEVAVCSRGCAIVAHADLCDSVHLRK